MSGLEIQKLINEDLRCAVARIGDPPATKQLNTSPWVAMSALQKAIRRRRPELAHAAAATLLKDAPDRLWRRLACIAAEDVGLGSLEAVGVATAALAGKRKRAELGGEWPVACAVVAELAAAPKCRAADDLLMTCQLHPDLDRRWFELRDLTISALVEVACGRNDIRVCALALSAALTSGSRGSGVPRPRRLTEPVFDRLCEAGWPHSVVEVARQNFNRTGVMLAPLVAMLSLETPQDAPIDPELPPPEVMIGDMPGWVFDIYSREGRAALSGFLDGDSATAAWLSRHVRPSRRLAVLGHFLFRIEGGVVDRRLCWALSARLRHEVDVDCAGIERDAASELLEIVRVDLPAINRARDERLSHGV